MLKKLLNILLSVFIILSFVGKTNFIYGEDEEDYYDEETSEKSDRDKCIEDLDEEACIAVARNAKSDLSDIEDKIKKAQKNQEESLKLAKEYAKEAATYQSDIDNLREQIEILKENIEQLEKQIAENELEVEELNTRVRDRMTNYQKTMHFNGYLEFILGSKSFVDMLRRIYGVKAITSKDKADRQDLVNIIAQLNTDKKELDENKKQLDDDCDELISKQAKLLIMEEFYEQQASEIQDELDEMTKQRDEYFQSFDDLKEALKDMGYTINDGFVAAVRDSYIEDGVWHYSNGFLGGTWHTGVDYASDYGDDLHAPAGGIIIRADDSCGYGYLGSTCGEWIAGGGNQVYLLCEVDGVVYGFMFFHLSRVDVSYGDYVFQDEVIGAVGSSGSSTGPHCHIEMYKLGYGTLSEILSIEWNATFSCGRHAEAYSNRCDVKDAPCILDPEEYLPG